MARASDDRPGPSGPIGCAGRRIAVVGAGYVGLVTAACLARLGHRVVCLEADPSRLQVLRGGRMPVHEPELEALVRRGRLSGCLNFADGGSRRISGAAIVFLTVQTPPTTDGRADLGPLWQAVAGLVPRLARSAILVIKSTVPVGTGDAVAGRLRRAGRVDVRVVANPEFLREGSAIRDFLEPDRIVIGAEDDAAGGAVAALYTRLRASIVRCDRRSAELAKYASNVALAVRISFINEVAGLCAALDADVDQVAAIVGADRRIGASFLQAGLGWGGSCFPKDVATFAAMAREHKVPAHIAEAAVAVNRGQRVAAAERLLASVPRSGARVGVLGLAFKPDTDDLRGSPALDIIERLLNAGVEVRAHDPVARPAAALTSGVMLCADPYEVAHGSDAVLLATDWRQYIELDWSLVRRAMRGRLVLDGRNVLDGEILRALGFDYQAFGRRESLARRRPASMTPAAMSQAVAPPVPRLRDEDGGEMAFGRPAAMIARHRS